MEDISYFDRPISSQSYLKLATPQRITRMVSPDLYDEYGRSTDNFTPHPSSKLLTAPQSRMYPLSISPKRQKPASRRNKPRRTEQLDIPPFLQGYLEGVRLPKKPIRSIVGDSYRSLYKPRVKPSQRESHLDRQSPSQVNRSFDIPKVSYAYFKERHQTPSQLISNCTSTPEPRLYKKRVISVNPRSKLTIYSTKEIPKPKPRAQQRKISVPKVNDSATEVLSSGESPSKFDYGYKEPVWTLGEKIKRVQQLSLLDQESG
jgi:hypothetical protein